MLKKVAGVGKVTKEESSLTEQDKNKKVCLTLFVASFYDFST